jgi:hypothetical protein
VIFLVDSGVYLYMQDQWNPELLPSVPDGEQEAYQDFLKHSRHEVQERRAARKRRINLDDEDPLEIEITYRDRVFLGGMNIRW